MEIPHEKQQPNNPIPPIKLAALGMTPTAVSCAKRFQNAVRMGECAEQFEVSICTLLLPNGEKLPIVQCNEASVKSLLDTLKPHPEDVLTELVEAGLLRKQSPNRYSITTHLLEATL